MLASEIIDLARLQIGDSVASYRWSDALLLGYLNEAQRLVASVHPAATYLTAIGTGIPTACSSVSSSIGVTDWYSTALVEYISYRVMGENSEDQNNAAQSQAHYQAFVASMG